MRNPTAFVFMLVFLGVCGLLQAQMATIDFEPAGQGADWAWTVTENGSNPAMTFPANPDNSAPNTSATVAQFTAEAAGAAWALTFTDDIEPFTFNTENCHLSIQVNKPVISPVAIKFEGSSAPIEIQVSNTMTDVWETINYDFSAAIGNTYNRLVIIPDFAARAEEHVVYFDNVVIPEGNTVIIPDAAPEVAAPVPTEASENVFSIYSDAYDDLPGTIFDPGWGEATVVTTDNIGDDNFMHYANFDFQGIQLIGAHNLTNMTHLHVDLWTDNATSVRFTPISAVTGEHLVELAPFTLEAWNSYDIPLGDFTGLMFNDIHQLKFDGQNGLTPSNVYIDNIYFYNDPTLSDDATLSDLRVDDETVSGFTPGLFTYNVTLPAGTTVVPTVTATTNHTGASYDVNDAAELPGATTVVVTAENGTATQTYTINFTVASGATTPQTLAPAPTHDAADVISIYSDTYTDLAGTNFSPSWGQTTTVSFESIAGGNVMKYANFNFQGTEFAGTQDFSSMEYVHIDMWTPDATVVLFSPISAPAGETLVSLTPIEHGQWNSYDIAVTDFTGVSLATVFQLKFTGEPGVWPSTVYLDNIYFWKTHVAPGTDTRLSDLLVNGETVDGFSPSILTYDVELPWDTTEVPTVTAFTNDPLATHEIFDATELPGTTEVKVTAQVGLLTRRYYINFTLEDEPVTPTAPAPTPTNEPVDVISIYSDAYDDIAGVNFSPYWGQTTTVSFESIGDNEMMKYANFNYQGTQFADNQDLSLMEYVHIDMWTQDATLVHFSPISPGGGETLVALDPIVAETWNSYDIPVTAFTNVVMSEVFQMKLTGENGVCPSTVYLDNIYFWKNPTTAGSDATLSDLQVDGVTIPGFSSTVINYTYELPQGTAVVPTVTATSNDSGAEYVINDATVIPGATTVVVTAEDGETTLTYTVNFTLADPTPLTAAPTPSEPAASVISLFSNTYADVTVDTWSAAWDVADVEDTQVAGDDVKLYTNLTYAGIEFTSQTINATSMTHFHMDIWTPDDLSVAGVFKVKLVDFGADGAWSGGDDVEHEMIFDGTVITSQNWVSLDLPLSDFTGLTTTGHLAQLIISGDPNTVYVDNVYFYGESSGPAAPQNVRISISGEEVTIIWDAAPDADSYLVYVADDPNGEFTPVSGGAYNDESWTGTVDGTRKYFRVTAITNEFGSN